MRVLRVANETEWQYNREDQRVANAESCFGPRLRVIYGMRTLRLTKTPLCHGGAIEYEHSMPVLSQQTGDRTSNPPADGDDVIVRDLSCHTVMGGKLFSVLIDGLI